MDNTTIGIAAAVAGGYFLLRGGVADGLLSGGIGGGSGNAQEDWGEGEVMTPPLETLAEIISSLPSPPVDMTMPNLTPDVAPVPKKEESVKEILSSGQTSFTGGSIPEGKSLIIDSIRTLSTGQREIKNSQTAGKGLIIDSVRTLSTGQTEIKNAQTAGKGLIIDSVRTKKEVASAVEKAQTFSTPNRQSPGEQLISNSVKVVAPGKVLIKTPTKKATSSASKTITKAAQTFSTPEGLSAGKQLISNSVKVVAPGKVLIKTPTKTTGTVVKKTTKTSSSKKQTKTVTSGKSKKTVTYSKGRQGGTTSRIYRTSR